jgi:hypothetical protein
MQNWNYSPENLICLTLAADARLGSTDYTNDQIWELKLGSSEPPVISLETTFGLRARLCRIFPRFIHNGKVVSDPTQFTEPITIRRYYPNYLELSFKPFSNINVKIEYWVPNSQVIAGRIKIINLTREKCSIQFELVELLLPSAEGSRMVLNEIEMATLLAGKTTNLFPVLFLTGGAQAGKSPYPSLQLSFTIPPLGDQDASWVHASLNDVDKSYEQIKEVVNKNWSAEIARVIRINSKNLEIHTGNKDWDTAFYLSQNLAYQLFLQPTVQCNAPSIVSTRKPDQGYSLLGDGTDYNHLWNGQTPFNAYYLLNLLLPTSPELVKGLVDNFLDVQTPQGEIDLKPGLASQRSHLLATPLLATIALQLLDYNEDYEYIKSVYPKLLSFLQSWFTSSHDIDGDQFPEWDQAIQTGFEDLPFYSQYQTWSSGVDISTMESPSLCAYLYRECISLMRIGEILNDTDTRKKLESYAEKLKSVVEQTWSDQHACYLTRDRDSHMCEKGEILGERTGEGIIEIHREFNVPVRPIIFIESQPEITHPTKIFIHGTGAADFHRVENISVNRIHWQHGYGYATSSYNYNLIEHIEINGVLPNDKVNIKTANLTFMDLSLLLPLWAGIPSKERAKILINLTIINKKKFLSPNGLRSWIESPGIIKIPEEYYGLNLPGNALILDGLIQYGERFKAAEVFLRIMEFVVKSIKNNMTLNHSYHYETGKLLGTQNSITSLVPIGLFLRILGVKILNPYLVEITGKNPFPWPVTIKYQGLIIIKQERKTLVIFPDGQNVTVDNDQFRRISCERTNQVVDKNT